MTKFIVSFLVLYRFVSFRGHLLYRFYQASIWTFRIIILPTQNTLYRRSLIVLAYACLKMKSGSMIAHWLSVPGELGGEIFSRLFLSCNFMIAIFHLWINSWLCKVIDSWINSSCWLLTRLNDIIAGLKKLIEQEKNCWFWAMRLVLVSYHLFQRK